MVPDRGLRFTASAPKPQHAQLHPYLAHMHERPSEDCHFENPNIIAYIWNDLICFVDKCQHKPNCALRRQSQLEAEVWQSVCQFNVNGYGLTWRRTSNDGLLCRLWWSIMLQVALSQGMRAGQITSCCNMLWAIANLSVLTLWSSNQAHSEAASPGWQTLCIFTWMAV